jgi:lipopolysaccharide export system permease protein
MKIVERYILRRSLLLAAGALFWTLSIVWTVQALGKLDIVTDSGQSAMAFFKLATYTLPAIVPLVIPFAIVIGVAQTLSSMNSDSELVVINAAGSSRMVTIKPVLVLAFGACIASFIVQNGIDPSARFAMRSLLADARADLLSTLIQEGTFKTIQKGLFVQIGERRPDGGLSEIMVADSRQKDLDLIYYAKDGLVGQRNGQNVLVMNDGVVQRKTPAGEVSIIRFSSYVFDLSSFAAAKSFLVLNAKDRSLAYLMHPDPNDPSYKADPQSFRSMFHQRLTEWLYPLVFALIALAVAGDARSHREARLHPMATALSLALLVRWLAYFVANEADSNPAFVPFLYVIPLLLSLLAIWCLATHRTLELPVTWTERLGSLMQRLVEKLTIYRLRLLGATGSAGGGSA